MVESTFTMLALDERDMPVATAKAVEDDAVWNNIFSALKLAGGDAAARYRVTAVSVSNGGPASWRPLVAAPCGSANVWKWAGRRLCAPFAGQQAYSAKGRPARAGAEPVSRKGILIRNATLNQPELLPTILR